MPVLRWDAGTGALFSGLSFKGMGLMYPGVNSDAAKLQHSYRSCSGSVFGKPHLLRMRHDGAFVSGEIV